MNCRGPATHIHLSSVSASYCIPQCVRLIAGVLCSLYDIFNRIPAPLSKSN